MADAQASGACGSNIVWVQVPSPAFIKQKGSSNTDEPFFVLESKRPFPSLQDLLFVQAGSAPVVANP